MITRGKRNVLGVLVDAVDYDAALQTLLSAAKEGRALSTTALAVHGLMTAVFDAQQRYRLNQYDLVVPDGQPVRWALNWLYEAGLPDRVYGPELMGRLLQNAAAEGLPVYLYGSTQEVLDDLQAALGRRYPNLRVAGAEPSRFRVLDETERDAIVERVRASGARLLFVGLGCPRQEVFTYEMRQHLSLPIIAVGAAFPFLAGASAQAPRWLQKRGLEWSFRLLHEPRRLWARYLLLNPAYVVLLLLQRLRVPFDTVGVAPTQSLLHG